MLSSIARYCFRHWVVILATWVVLLIGVNFASAALGPRWLDGGSIKGTDSAKALQILEEKLPEQAARAGEKTGTIVFENPEGVKNFQPQIEAYLEKLVNDKKVTRVETVLSPL